MTRTENLHELSGAYALDALDDGERARFEAHLRSCGACRIEVAEFQQVAVELAGQSHGEPPPALKASVLAAVSETRQEGPRVKTVAPRRFGRAQTVLAVAAAVALLVVGGIAFTQPSADPTSEVVSAPDAVISSLEATSDTSLGSVRIAWSDEQDQVAVIADELADPGEGMAYALWFLLEDGVAPAGLFVPENGSVTAVLPVADFDTTGWGITIEPASGSAQPTSPVLFAGSI